MPATMSLMVALVATATPATEDPVLAEVRARDIEMAAAHGRGDLVAYRAGLSSRYVYIDVGGKRVTADQLLKRRENDERRVVSSTPSEDEAIRLSETVVLLRGREDSVATYYGGLPRVGASRWSALWVREDDGVWRVVAETATPVRASEHLPFVHTPQAPKVLDDLAGRWTLALQPPMHLTLRAEDGKLIGSLDGKTVRFNFLPASPTHFFADDRPFELRFAADGQALDMVTWGTVTKATRAAE